MLGYSRKRAISEMTQSESVKVKSEDVQPTKKLKIKIETDKEGGQNNSATVAFKPPNYKTVPCKNFALDGNCQFGSRCTFKHGPVDDGQSLPTGVSVPQNYKIVPCRSWSQSRKCTHGDRCTFMHGDSDYKGGLFLKPYKKIPCKFFAEIGFCQRGMRCGFIHGRALEPGILGGFAPISSPRPRLAPILMGEAISAKSRVSIRSKTGYLLGQRDETRLSGLSESRFVTPSRFLDVSGITTKTSAASIFPGILRGGRNQAKPIPPNYKTVACTNWAKDGKCRFGSSCTYKHGDETVDPPVLVERPKLQHRIPVPLKSDSEYKSVPCMAFIQTAFCQYGDECWFIHGNEGQKSTISLRQAIPIEMALHRARPMPLRQASFPEPGGLVGFPLKQNRSFGAGGKKPNYKTVMCKHWEKDGKCPFNEKCTYKHGNEDSGRPI